MNEDRVIAARDLYRGMAENQTFTGRPQPRYSRPRYWLNDCG